MASDSDKQPANPSFFSPFEPFVPRTLDTKNVDYILTRELNEHLDTLRASLDNLHKTFDTGAKFLQDQNIPAGLKVIELFSDYFVGSEEWAKLNEGQRSELRQCAQDARDRLNRNLDVLTADDVKMRQSLVAAGDLAAAMRNAVDGVYRGVETTRNGMSSSPGPIPLIGLRDQISAGAEQTLLQFQQVRGTLKQLVGDIIDVACPPKRSRKYPQGDESGVSSLRDFLKYLFH